MSRVESLGEETTAAPAREEGSARRRGEIDESTASYDQEDKGKRRAKEEDCFDEDMYYGEGVDLSSMLDAPSSEEPSPMDSDVDSPPPSPASSSSSQRRFLGLGISPPTSLSINSLHLFFQQGEPSCLPLVMPPQHPFDPTFSPPHHQYNSLPSPSSSATSSPPSTSMPPTPTEELSQYDDVEDMEVEEILLPQPDTISAPSLLPKDLFRLAEDDMDDDFLLAPPTFSPPLLASTSLLASPPSPRSRASLALPDLSLPPPPSPSRTPPSVPLPSVPEREPEEDDPRFVDLRPLRRIAPMRHPVIKPTSNMVLGKQDELRLIALGTSNAKRTGQGYFSEWRLSSDY